MEDKVYEVDSVYPRVAALLRREYAGMNCMGQILEKCTSVTPSGIMQQFERLLKDTEKDCGTLEATEMLTRPLQCPFDNTRGCLDGQIWIIEHVRIEDGYNTTECRIRGHQCAAWSDEYNRCVRLQSITGADKARRFQEMKNHDPVKNEPWPFPTKSV